MRRCDPKGDPGLGGDIFLEPSETRPLPPADLPFPALDRLLPVAVPLPIGQHPGAYDAIVSVRRNEKRPDGGSRRAEYLNPSIARKDLVMGKLSDILHEVDQRHLAAAWDTTEAAEDFTPLPAGDYTCHVIGGEIGGNFCIWQQRAGRPFPG